MGRPWLVPLFGLSLLALATAACGGGEKIGPTGYLNHAGIEGTVTIGPMCPVVQEGTACPDQPYQATITILDEEGDEVMTFETTEDGHFSSGGLFPGRYTIVPHSPNEGAPPFAAEQSVEVSEGAYTQVTIQYDSGIR